MLRILTRHSLGSFTLVLCFATLLLGATASAQTNPSPYLYPLYPAATPPGGPAFTLTVTGTGFVSGAVVNWNGSPRPTTFVSNSKVTAAITAADIATPKTALITVTNPAPGGGTSNSQNFQVTFPYDALTFQDSILSSLTIPNFGQPGVGPIQVLTGDFNRDGKPDLVVLSLLPRGIGASTYSIQILIGNGDGTFQPPSTIFNVPEGSFVNDLAVADLNGDGNLDLVGSYTTQYLVNPQLYYDNGIFVFLGNGDGTFQPAVESSPDPSGATQAVETLVADVNGDGIPDLVQRCAAGICVALGNGDGTFREQTKYSAPNSVLAVGDFHGQGKLDILTGLYMLQGNGDGTFEAPKQIATLNSSALNDIAVADFDHDGNLDFEVYYLNSQPPFPVSPSNAGAMSLFQGDGNGTFQAPLTLTDLPDNIYETFFDSTLLVPGDFNGDGSIDLAFRNVVLLIGNATGPLNHSLVSTPNVALATADFNGDGRLDLVGIDSNQNVHVMLQTSVPDFVGSINDPPYQDVRPGQTATYTINVTSINGFAGTIGFSASGLPPGTAATFTPSTLVGSGTVTVTITTSRHTPKGSFPVLVSGTSVGITHSGGLELNVGRNDEKFEDFSGTITPAYQTVVPGGSTTYQINIIPHNGFDSDVRLQVRDLPPGATATLNPDVVTGGSGSSVLTITTANPTPTATYNLTVIGEGGHRKHENGMNLNVGPAGTDFTDYIGTISPLSQMVQVGGVTTFTAYIQPINGTGCVYLQVLGLPPATGDHFDRTTGICGAPASTVFTITTYPQTPPGTYTLQFQGTTTGGFTHTTAVTLTVAP